MVETNSATPTKRKKHCNCRNSHCLKLYCECFAAGTYCDGCNCKHCGNKVENESVRQEAINSTKQRNPSAFQPKIENGSNALGVQKDDAGAPPSFPTHNKGCHCRKTGCLKKYCECFQANVFCSDICKCKDCKNTKEGEELRAINQGDNSSDRHNTQEAANVALNGAIGSSGYRCSPVRRKRTLEGSFGQMMQTQFQEVNHMDSSEIASSTGLEGYFGNFHGRSKMLYKSPLANTIAPTDVTDLAKRLVIKCKEAADTLMTTTDNIVEMKVEREICTNSDSAGHMDQHNAGDFGSNGSNTQKDSRPASPGTQALMCDEDYRPASPGTQALMCDEQGTTFGTDYRSSFPVASYEQDTSELHALQEKEVLVGIRDYLRGLITLGKIKETNWSSEAARQLDVGRHNGATTILPTVKADEKIKAEETSPSTSNCGSKDQV